MILALDVYYDDSQHRAQAAGVLISRWSATEPCFTFTRIRTGTEPYVPGELYRRELPCILPIVGQAASAHALHTLLIDGFVDLAEQRAGLGRHLFNATHGRFEVVGVAKKAFQGKPGIPVWRGHSSRPLWVTSTGNQQQAAQHVASMAGEHRIPSLLRLVDRLTRQRSR